jgi:hypothetical protein
MRKIKKEYEELDINKLERLLKWLHPNRSIASREYDDLYLKLKVYFEQNNCDPGKAFETFMIIANRIEQEDIIRDKNGNEVIDKKGYIFGIAKKINLEYQRQKVNVETTMLPDHALPDALKTLPNTLDNEKKDYELFLETSKKVSIQMFQQTHRDKWKLLREYLLTENSQENHEKMARQKQTTIENLRVHVCRSKTLFWHEYNDNIQKFQKKFGY